MRLQINVECTLLYLYTSSESPFIVLYSKCKMLFRKREVVTRTGAHTHRETGREKWGNSHTHGGCGREGDTLDKHVSSYIFPNLRAITIVALSPYEIAVDTHEKPRCLPPVDSFGVNKWLKRSDVLDIQPSNDPSVR